MHNVSMFVCTSTPIEGLAQTKDGIVHEPKVPAMDRCDSPNYWSGAYDGGEEGDEYGNAAKIDGN